jgi:hypothetical protein
MAGSGLSIRVDQLNTVVVAAMPKASVITATTVKAGL